jgi:hypothetical protein
MRSSCCSAAIRQECIYRYLPQNTGNWFSYRIVEDDEEIGTVEIGRGSIFWKPYPNKRAGSAFRRTWRDFALDMEQG